MKVLPFADKELESYVRIGLDKKTGEITEEDLKRIQYLDLAGKIFTDITPIVYCQNLREIRLPLAFTEIYDISLLKNIPSLRKISVFNPQMIELQKLAEQIPFQILQIMYWGDRFWGDVILCDLNAFDTITSLSIMNFTEKPFSCKLIQNLTNLRSLRLCSYRVEDTDVLTHLPMLEYYQKE